MSRSRVKIIADENVPRQVAAVVESLGYSVLWVAREPGLRGVRNDVLLDLDKEGAVLLTCGSGFLTPSRAWKIVYLEHTGDP